MPEAGLSAAEVGKEIAEHLEKSREHEVEGPGSEAAFNPREVAEQDPEIGVGIREIPGSREPARIALGVDTDDLNLSATLLDDNRLVSQQVRHIAQAVELRGT